MLSFVRMRAYGPRDKSIPPDPAGPAAAGVGRMLPAGWPSCRTVKIDGMMKRVSSKTKDDNFPLIFLMTPMSVHSSVPAFDRVLL